MHAVYMLVALLLATGLCGPALGISNRMGTWADRRVLYACILLAPVLSGALLGGGIVRMLLMRCRSYSALDWLGSIGLLLLLGCAFVSGAIARMRARHRSRTLQQELCALGGAPMAELEAVVLRMAARAGLRRPPRVILVQTDRPFACLAGVRRPTLVCSVGLVTMLDMPEIEAVVLHELCHLRNGDNLSAAALGWIRDALGLLPMVRSVWQRFLAEREQVADALAARILGEPEVVAGAILKVWEGQLGSPAPRLAHVAAFADPVGLEERIERLLDTEAQVPGHRGGAMALSIALLGVAAVLAAPIYSETLCMRLFCRF